MGLCSGDCQKGSINLQLFQPLSIPLSFTHGFAKPHLLSLLVKPLWLKFSVLVPKLFLPWSFCWLLIRWFPKKYSFLLPLPSVPQESHCGEWRWGFAWQLSQLGSFCLLFPVLGIFCSAIIPSSRGEGRKRMDGRWVWPSSQADLPSKSGHGLRWTYSRFFFFKRSWQIWSHPKTYQ